MKKKVDNYFGLWSAIMDAGGDKSIEEEDPLGQLLDRIFKESKDGREAMEGLDDELDKVKDVSQRENLRAEIENLVTESNYLHLSAGFALGGLYDVMEPQARAQIDYLRERIHKAGVFVMAAK